MANAAPFDADALQAYLMEAADLAANVLYRLERLREASNRWQRARHDSLIALRVLPREYDHATHAESLQRVAAEHREVFDELEALLSAWARISLLLKPDRGTGALGKFSSARGHVLRTVLTIPDDSLVLDRDLRNAWMHFDERLDEAILAHGKVSNRHRFIHSSAAASDEGSSLRLIEVDLLRVTYPGRGGQRKSVELLSLFPAIQAIVASIPEANGRFRALFRTPVADDQDSGAA